jgi:hypothetical protein
MTSETFKAWAAGFVDGEGCIMFRRSPDRTARGRGPKRLRNMCVQVTQKQSEPLRLLQQHWGGALTDTLASGCFRWRVSSQEAVRFLLDIEPYLVVKRRQCTLALMFSDTIDQRQRMKWPTVAARELLDLAIRRDKHKEAA